MDSVWNFLSMGGYAAFVWPAIGSVALGMALLLWHTLRTLKQRERTLAALTRNNGLEDDAEA